MQPSPNDSAGATKREGGAQIYLDLSPTLTRTRTRSPTDMLTPILSLSHIHRPLKCLRTGECHPQSQVTLPWHPEQSSKQLLGRRVRRPRPWIVRVSTTEAQTRTRFSPPPCLVTSLTARFISSQKLDNTPLWLRTPHVRSEGRIDPRVVGHASAPTAASQTPLEIKEKRTASSVDARFDETKSQLGGQIHW